MLPFPPSACPQQHTLLLGALPQRGVAVSPQAMHEYLRSICSDVVVTQGDFDGSTHWPETAVVSVGGLKIGLCHGHQVVPWGDADVLASLQRRMGIDILLTGHTHAFKAFERDGRLVINPGSGTGAPSTIAAGPPPVPSFVLMDVDGTKATIYVYELGPDEQVKVEKIEYAKKAPAL